jgi:hypothetical protein
LAAVVECLAYGAGQLNNPSRKQHSADVVDSRLVTSRIRAAAAKQSNGPVILQFKVN